MIRPPLTVVFDGDQVRIIQHHTDITPLDLAQISAAFVQRAIKVASCTS